MNQPPQAAIHLYQRAAAFAARRHRHQVRKDGRTPYVSHVFRVAMTVSHVFGCHDDLVIAAALLHDTIEDTTTDYEDIESCFGTDVADMVSALTKNMALPEPEREREYDQRLAGADWRVWLIKLADTYDNFSDALDTAEERSSLGDHLNKCLRAISLARRDADAREVIRRAAELTEQLIAPYRRG
ncbi:MAG: bifunctional (p)ppGpp synthetase/guanosine-3',5'-bis(diphosphate) 3'-pyrophosphohydrolase [Phycisphaeraceae bacterium]|nr:bifunctional (p)ppGpp synthetase/guanosine-3',5'-bis(diphosphate) 3'-pyrophosphohydrolase [Phycisphaerae bacterium]MBX3391884.1 bifunctional (p)ppGpp synthetase/guanosine-3',5'-bis(diphosphate) 3'-pyrophosphohydrolase [Phycisphaeraceae bacterium]HRJ49814.1 HD domain-containing protein [Phycisphaerales bacterium]